VVNYLNIARKLKYFAARESEHFIVKVDERYDRVLLDLVSDYMEEIYPEVCGDYGYEPKHKVIVEIMPFQDQFSLRIAGRGWVPTVGACTGPVIVLTAPNKSRPGVPLGLHNWAAVLRHEFAHAVTLEQTRNRIPHWLTEACAVWQQQDKRAYRYIMTLVSATQNNHLFSVRDLDWGFIRPKRRGDRQLAYAQSEWIMDHIIRTRGFETIRNMLRAFGEGMSQEDVFDKIVGWPGETAEEANGRKYTETLFDKDFRAWAGRMVREWGFDPEPILQSADTAKLIRENPEDADAHAKHALALMRPNAAAAEAAAHKALEIDERNVLALRVLANLFFNRKLYVAAEDVCRKLEAIDPANKTAPKILARCYLAKKKWPDAVAALELLQTRHPLDAFSYTELAKLHVQLGQPEKALPSLIHLHKHSMGDPQYARQIAEIHRSLGQYDQALRYFREVTHINPYETTAYEGIAGVCVRTKDYDRAQAAAVNMTLVEPEKAKSWNYLATVRYRAGKNTKNADLLRQARRDAEKAKQLEPNPLSDQIVEHIDAALTSLQEKP
jgi:tetratricopeptide (TPR) repeat protein